MFVEGGGSKKQYVAEGETLFKEGEKGDAAYIVNSGKIGIYKYVEGQEVELAVLNPGELFGEMAIFDGSARMAHAVAIEESVVIKIPADALNSRLAKADPFIKALMNILVQSLRGVHNKYMRRSRSLNDYINAAEFHLQSFRMFLSYQKNDARRATGHEKLDQIDKLLSELRELDYPDRRESVVRDTDLSRQKPDD
jgi:CRP/FNR family cyclic AMP-dependent transcriptional regulator